MTTVIPPHLIEYQVHQLLVGFDTTSNDGGLREEEEEEGAM